MSLEIYLDSWAISSQKPWGTSLAKRAMSSATLRGPWTARRRLRLEEMKAFGRFA